MRGGKPASRCVGYVPAEMVDDLRIIDREIRLRREQLAREKDEARRRAAEEARAGREAERLEGGRQVNRFAPAGGISPGLDCTP